MQVIDDLTMLVKVAKHRADKRTSFEKAQHRLALVYNRPAYQNTVTALLVVVGLPCRNFPLAQSVRLLLVCRARTGLRFTFNFDTSIKYVVLDGSFH
jgi:hypothetical protein